mgnify:FL=1
MNEQGVTTIPSEVREVLNIDGKRAILRVKNIEVAKITEDPTTESELEDKDEDAKASNEGGSRGQIGARLTIMGVVITVCYIMSITIL